MDLLRLQKYLLMARMAADSTFLVDKEEPGLQQQTGTTRRIARTAGSSRIRPQDRAVQRMDDDAWA